MGEKAIEIKITKTGTVSVDLENFNPDEHNIIDALVKSLGDEHEVTIKDEHNQERVKEQIKERNK